MTARLAWPLLAAALACSAPGRENDAGYHGMVPDIRIEKPDFTFTDTDGRPFDFRKETDGFVTLLFFGYTSCPDVCPVHMANLGEVLLREAADVSSRIKVVFVTTDPDRDSLPAIRRWLNAFHRGFIGLRAPLAEVNLALEALRLPGAQVERQPDGTVAVAHPAAIVAFTRDNAARVYYPFGVRQEDWAHDLPRLVRDPGLPAAVAPEPRVTQLVIVAPAGDAPAAMYGTIRFDGASADTLVGCEAAGAASCSLHDQQVHGASATMRPVDAIALRAPGVTRLAPGGLHGMLRELRRPLVPGDTWPVTLRFARHGSITVPAAVITYGQVERVLGTEAR